MGWLDSIFGGGSKNSSSDDKARVSKSGTKFRDATKGRVIIEKPGYKPAIGHAEKSPPKKT
jgi:hypothetical protein